MASIGLLPDSVGDEEPNGKFLTFVVAAPNGCNLSCSYCLVRQRGEITEHSLGPNDLARFIEEVAERGPIYALAIQGHEPLLPGSLPFTEAVLMTGRRLGRPTTLVTNGVHLGNALDFLKALAPKKIAVSLDSALAETHDCVRGVTGAWLATVRGIRRAVEILTPWTSVVVSSVLIPSRAHYLKDMPAQLRDIGVREWIVNPLLRFGPAGANGPVGNRLSLFRDLLRLQEISDRASIELTVDDEFDRLNHGTASASQPEFSALRVRKLPPKIDIFRMSPNGETWKGEDILKRAGTGGPRWHPGTAHASDFLAALSYRTCRAPHRLISQSVAN